MSKPVTRAGAVPLEAPAVSVLPRRWYPYGTRFPYGKESRAYVTRVEEGVAFGYTDAPSFFGPDTREVRLDPLVLRASLQPSALQQRIRNCEGDIADLRSARQEPYDHLKAKLAWLQGLLAGDTGPEVFLDNALVLDVLVQPTAAFFEDHPRDDFWWCVDRLTGGCCNSEQRCLSGLSLYEATASVGLLSVMKADPHLKVMGFSARLPAGGEEYLSPALLQQLRDHPSVQEMQEAAKAQWSRHEASFVLHFDNALQEVVAPALEAKGMRLLGGDRNGQPSQWHCSGLLAGEIEIQYDDGRKSRSFVPAMTIAVELNSRGEPVAFRAHDSILRVDEFRQVLPAVSTRQRYADHLVALDQIQQAGAVLPGEPLVFETLQGGYGDSHPQAPEESRAEWIARCAEQDFDDAEAGGCLFEDLAASLIAEEARCRARMEREAAKDSEPVPGP